MAALKLDRSHTNHAFGQWKYQKDIIQSSERIPLPEHVFKPDVTAPGFLSTRAHVMHNHLCTSDGVFMFVGSDRPTLLQIESGAITPLISASSPPSSAS